MQTFKVVAPGRVETGKQTGFRGGKIFLTVTYEDGTVLDALLDGGRWTVNCSAEVVIDDRSGEIRITPPMLH